MTAIIVVGLPGSGKSWLLEHFNIGGLQVYDDISKQKEKFFKVSLAFDYIRTLPIVLSDPGLCDEKNLAALIKMVENIGYNTCVMYFENDPEKCYNNVEYRADGRIVKNYIKQLSKIYKPKYPVMKIWQPEEEND